MKKIKEYVISIINGLCMSIADSVPGVSGGTVAFILGFYDKFINSLDDLFRGNWEKKKEAFKYLFKIGIGWVIGLLLSIVLLANLFDAHIYQMCSLFIGFIIFAIPIVIHDELKYIRGNYKNIAFLIMGFLFVFIITYLNRKSGINYDISSLNIGTIIYVFFTAALAISAMILPGISGSTVMLIFGIYIPIITKVKAFLGLDFSTIPILVVFGLGMIFGIVFFTKVLKYCINKKRSAVVYAIIGMMLASIYSIIYGPTTLDVPQDILTYKTFSLAFFALGGIIILALEGLKKYLNSK